MALIFGVEQAGRRFDVQSIHETHRIPLLVLNRFNVRWLAMTLDALVQ